MNISDKQFEEWWANKKDVVRIAWPKDFRIIEDLVKESFQAGFMAATGKDQLDKNLGPTITKAIQDALEGVKVTVAIQDSSMVNQ